MDVQITRMQIAGQPVGRERRGKSGAGIVALFMLLAVLLAACATPMHGLETAVPPIIERELNGRLRLMTYNIHWGRGTDGVLDLDRIVDTIRRADAHIVVLTEVDVNWRRSGNVDQARYIAQQAGYPYAHFGPALRTWASGNTRVSQYGNLLLSQFPIDDVETIRLPDPGGREPRAAIAATVNVEGEPITVLGTHLGLNERERRQQVARLQQLADAAQRKGKPVVLMGDFNAHPTAPEIQRLGEGPYPLADAHTLAGDGPGYTFAYPEPYARIDYVFVSDDLAPFVTDTRGLSVPGSDHLPVTTEVRWPVAIPEKRDDG